MSTTTALRVMPWWQGWAPVFVLPIVAAIAVPATWPRWALMWTLSVAIFAGCKFLTLRRTPVPDAKWWMHVGYLLAWPGLDAASFLDTSNSSRVVRPSVREWSAATSKVVVGGTILWIISNWIPPDEPLLFGWIGMIGLILFLHFGLFHVLSCAWRSCGVDARLLMDRPLASVSLSEFWGKRWNTAFRDLTYRFLFRPFTAALGPRWAIAAGFVFSGSVHDVVISIPSGGGYGLPTLFFVIQATGRFIERSRLGRSVGLGKGVRGWAFTMVLLVVPAYGLFHPPFVLNIIVPFMEAIGCRRP